LGDCVEEEVGRSEGRCGGLLVAGSPTVWLLSTSVADDVDCLAGTADALSRLGDGCAGLRTPNAALGRRAGSES